ncbi:MAG: hypothetical protein AABY05_02420 [Nanoarchaeota archaeon]
MRNVNVRLGLVGRLIPDMYLAITVHDFIASRADIPLPSSWKKLSPFSGFLVDGKHAIVYLHNTNITNIYDGENDLVGHKIQDFTDELTVTPCERKRLRDTNLGIISPVILARPEELEEGRYYKVGILYRIREDLANICSLQKNGPPSPDESSSLFGTYLQRFVKPELFR